jgi:hemerythrin
MGRIEPEELPELRVPFMEADHRKEIGLVNDLEEALAAHASGGPDTLDPVLARLALLAVQTREHFLREEGAMRVTRFPAYVAHKAEHDRILAEMDHEARLFRTEGDAGRLSRYLFEALPAWYRGHLTMDVAVAEHLAERRAEPAPAVPQGV